MALPAMISAKALGAMPQFVLEVAGEKRLTKALDAADLPFHFIEERSGYISVRSLATFVHEAARTAGQQNIGLLWSPHLTVADYGAWGSYVLSAPTLGSALNRASSVMPFHSSTDRAWLESNGTESRYCYHFELRSHRAYSDIGFSAIGVFLSVFRAYLGVGWKPSAILLDFPRVPKATQAEDTFQCPVIWEAPRLGVQFHTSYLQAEAARIPQAGVTITIQDIARERIDGPPETIGDQVAALARHQFSRNEVSIDATARSLGLGIRTLQRKLESDGLQFRQIVNHVRIERAAELLSVQSETVSEIAFSLGYETANNFSRAFKKSTGASPTEFRKKLIRRA